MKSAASLAPQYATSPPLRRPRWRPSALPKSGLAGLPARLLRRIAAALLLIFTIVALVAVAFWPAIEFATRKDSLPDAKMLAVILREPVVTIERRTDGGVEAQCSCPLTIAHGDIPRNIRDALIAIEDRRLFVHSGADWVGLARAAVADIFHLSVKEGGSTITEQLAKTIVGNERTLRRKLRELVVARRIEQTFSKDEIVDLYLNRVFFGHNVWGVEAAARYYFGKRAKELSVIEAAMLAGMLKAPSRYDPLAEPKAARDRAKVVLDSMVEEGSLKQEWAKQAANAAVSRGEGRIPDLALGHYMSWIAREVAAIDPAFRADGSQWRVSVPLDVWRQLVARDAIESTRDEALAHDAHEAALVAMGVDGSVLALVGGRDFGQSQFDRATQALRQPGSPFKPFVYLAALEAGRKPTDWIEDAPITINGWSPEDADKKFLGRITLTHALAGSRNAATVRLAAAIGFPRVAAVAARFEIPTGKSMAFVLGTEATRLIDVTSAYASFASGGFLVRPRGVIAVLDLHGAVRYRAPAARGAPVAAPSDIAALTGMLQAAARHWIKDQAGASAPFAGKSGTTQDNRDAWFVGFSGGLVVGVWIGNDDDSPMKGEAGGVLPARIWRDVVTAQSR